MPEDRYAFAEIPLYLQHLLLNVSRQHTEHADNYDRLVRLTLPLEDVVFISLNYDTLLDRSLEGATGVDLHGLDAYFTGRNWCLVKVHGSVNWVRRVRVDPDPLAEGWPPNDPFMARTFERLIEEIRPRGRIEFRPFVNDDFRSFRADNSFLFYPALAVPLGSADTVVCPPDHLDNLRARLQYHDPLNLLVVGYSGLDERVVELLVRAGHRLGSVGVFNLDRDASNQALDKISSAFADRSASITLPRSDGFGNQVRGELQAFVASL